MSSKVYFSDFRCKGSDSRLAKLERLVKAAGIEQIDFQDKYVELLYTNANCSDIL